MNERIRELARQSGGIDMTNHTAGGITAWVGTGTPEFLERFAELIVKEMLQTCEDHPAWTGRMIGEEIKQHFGVEE
jgi:hypothetical protein